MPYDDGRLTLRDITQKQYDAPEGAVNIAPTIPQEKPWLVPKIQALLQMIQGSQQQTPQAQPAQQPSVGELVQSLTPSPTPPAQSSTQPAQPELTNADRWALFQKGFKGD